MNAHDGAGFVGLHQGQPDAAARRFREALALYPDHARSLVGLGASLAAKSDKKGAADAYARAGAAIEALRRGGRSGEATLAEAFLLSVKGEKDRALDALRQLLDRADFPFTGWTIPIEPFFQPLRKASPFQGILGTLAERAR
jgi:tetratricopeptide (TPR) repeat protein